MVIGQVGSGKTSFLLSILNELKSNNKIIKNGTTSYVS
jgi:polynucleotide 5'-kinase involved in rRNA processing